MKYFPQVVKIKSIKIRETEDYNYAIVVFQGDLVLTNGILFQPRAALLVKESTYKDWEVGTILNDYEVWFNAEFLWTDADGVEHKGRWSLRRKI